MTSVDGTGRPADEPADEPAYQQPAAARPVDFRILTPANWYVLDLNPVTRTSSIARLVEQRFGPTDDPRLVAARRELTALLRGAARDAADNGAVYAALMDALVDGTALSASLLAVVGPAPRDEDGNVLTDPAALSATLLASELTAALDTATTTVDALGTPATTPAASTPAASTPAAGAPGPGGGGGSPAQPSGAARLDDASEGEGDEAARAEIVQLPAGPAVRLRRRTDSGLAGTTGQTVPAAETQYFLAIPATDLILVLTFATPNIGFQAEFAELFDRMAQTLHWQWETVA
jgi:hypothetical protein